MPAFHALLTEPVRTESPSGWPRVLRGPRRTSARSSGRRRRSRRAAVVAISLVVHVLAVIGTLVLMPAADAPRPLIVRIDARSFDQRATAPIDHLDVGVTDEVEELRPVEAEAFELHDPLPPVDVSPERFADRAHVEPVVDAPRPRGEPRVRDLFAKLRPDPSPPPAPNPTRATPQPSPPHPEATPAAESPRPDSSRTLTARPGDATPPRYPEAARRRGIEGTVLVTVVVGADGIPIQCHVQRSSGSKLLDDAALRAAWSWRFDGGPGSAEIPFVFRLRSR